MKRILSFAAVMLGLVALSSCMKENIEPSQEGSTNGTFTISVPQDVVTKAYGDGKFAAKNVIIGVFDENGVERYRKNYEWGTDKFTETITLPFVMGKSYQMVFWAQYGNAYGDPKEMELKEITMPYTKSNQENLDAFYWYEPVFPVTKDFTKNITMRRPFAQVNFATTPGDIDESIAAGLDVNLGDKAVVTVKNAAKTLNLFTGETSDYAEVSVPATEFPKDANGKYHEITVEGKTYEILAMNYFLVADKDAVDGKTTAEMSLKVGELELSVPQAQMKRNYRTNIVGELLTGEGTFNVTIDPIFGGDFNHNGITGDGSEEIKPAFAAVASTKNAAKIDAKGGKYYVDVTSNVAWTVTAPQGLTAAPASGDKNAEVAVTVPENTTDKEVTYEVVVKTTADVATKEYKFTITQAAAAPVTPDPEPEQPEQPEQPVLADGTYWIVSGTNYATPLTGNYGYIKVETAGYIDNAFKFTAVNGGYTIQDPAGKYYYQTGTYDSFNVTTEMPADGAVWTVAKNDDGTYVITNVSVNKSIQYDTQYNSYGSYAELKGLYPTLVDASKATERPAPEVPEGEAAKYATNVTCTTVASAYTDGVATVNGVSDIYTLKLGTSKLNGEAKITLPAGTTKLNYYAVGWKGTTAKLQFTLGNDVTEQAIAANDGATGNSPYIMRIADTDHYTITLSAALTVDTEITVKTTGSAYRAILFGIQAE